MTPKPSSTPRIAVLAGALLLTSAMLEGTTLPAQAGSLNDIRRSLSNLWGQQRNHRDEARGARAKATAVNAQAGAVHEELEKTQQLLQVANQNYANYFSQVRATEAKIVGTRHRIQKVNARYKKHKARFAQRLSAMQRHGKPGYLQVVFGSQSFSDLTRRTSLFQRLTETDAQLQAQIKADKAELETTQNLLMAQWAERKQLLQQVSAERARVAKAEEARSNQLKRLYASRSELLAYAAAQEQSSRELGSMISDLERRRSQIIAEYEAQAARERAEARARAAAAPRITGSRERRTAPEYARRIEVGEPQYAPRIEVEDVAPSRGWVMPARGRLSSRFGVRYHPVLHRTKLHTGDDIAAPHGSPIRAAKSGRVLWAGWKKAYGNTIIIDVGNGCTMLYGHASKLSVRPGQPVKAGEYIGNVGSTGWSTGPHLHFEVRKGGRPVSPMGYLRGR